MKILKKTVTILVLLFTTVPVWAYDFSAIAPSGQTLYFKIENGAAVVVYPGNATPVEGWEGYQKPTGDLTIPSTISNGATTYNVVAVGSHAFYNCVGLTSLVISEGVSKIRINAFNECAGLTSIVVPSTVDSIGGSFKRCTSLEQFTIGRDEPPLINAVAFTGVDLSACTLNVPCQSVANYSAVEPWNQFGTITDAGCAVTLTLGVNVAGRGSVAGSGTFEAGSAVVAYATPATGFFFGCWNDGDTTNPRVVVMQSDRQLTAFFFPMLHDTVNSVTIQHDTVTVTLPQHDTVYVTHTVHDTVQVPSLVRDTVYVINTVHDTIRVAYPVHDTVAVVNTVHDTVTILAPQHDTVLISYPIHDTVLLPYAVHDTVYVPFVHYDTITVVQTDTVEVHDTVMPTFCRLQVVSGDASRGLAAGSCVVPAGTEIEMAAIPLEGYRFAGWLDGPQDNPRRVQVNTDQGYTALFVESPQSSVVSAAEAWTLDVSGRAITIACPANARIRIIDMQGRIVYQAYASSDRTTLVMSQAGAFLVQVGDAPARRFVVTE